MADFGRKPDSDAAALIKRAMEDNDRAAVRADEEAATLELDAKDLRAKAQSCRDANAKLAAQLAILTNDVLINDDVDAEASA